MDRSELKKVDEAFSYNSSVNFATVHLHDALQDMNSELAKMDELLCDAGVEGIYHTNHADDITYSAEFLGELLAYSSNLAFYAQEYLDKPLYENFNLHATESISRIKVEDYKTPNTLGIKFAYVHADETEDLDTLQDLTIDDFLGITAPENGGQLREIPKEFSDFSNQYVTLYENLKDSLIDEDGNPISLEDYLDQLATMGEFSHTKDQPFRQFLSALLDLTIIVPIYEACTGYDFVTDEDLSDFDKGMKFVGGVVGLFTLGQSGLLEVPAEEFLSTFGRMAVVDVASTSASYWTGYACNEMDLPLPLTMFLSMAMGMGTSYKLNKFMVNNTITFEKEATDDMLAYVSDEDLAKINRWQYRPDDVTYANYKAYFDNPSFVNQVTGEVYVPLDTTKMTEILNIPKGMRPDPSTYLSQEYIDVHLSEFEDGISVIQTDWAYSRYSETNGFVGVPDDNTLFVMPQKFCDDVIAEAGGDISIIEKRLGFPEGYFKDGGGLVRIDVDNTSGLNLRMPNGNETGANSLWIPGGRTSGGVPEAITNTIPLERTNITRIEVK